MLGISGWTGLGLAVYSLATTLLTFWLAGCLWGRGQTPQPRSLWMIAGHLLWSAVLFVASVIATRYVERVEAAWPGYVALVLALGLSGFLLSLFAARLRLRAVEGQQAEKRPPHSRLASADLVHNLAYLLLALVLFLLLSALAGGGADPALLIPLFVGSLLPDLDSSRSLAGRLLPAISDSLERRLGHKQAWHTPAVALTLAVLALPLALLLGGSLLAWSALPLGFIAHLLLDMFTPAGIMLLWPLNRARYHLPIAPVRQPGDPAEQRIAAGLAAVALVLLLLVGLGPEPLPPPAPAPSYEQTLDSYHSWRGRYLVFASVQGTWQTSGLRLSGRFEVLNAVGTSYVLLDRYTGKVFAAGRNPDDHVYLDSISLQTGSQVQVKPVEILLEKQPLAEGLTVLYEMQREPGLEYIYVFGDIVVATQPDDSQVELPLDHSLTGLPQIQSSEASHYRLQYLPAAALISLAEVEVETANLLIVATYSSPPAGPTATPLPSLPATREAGP